MIDYKWLFDGVAGAALISITRYILHRFRRPEPQVANTAVGNSGPVYQQSPTINIQPTAPNNTALRHAEWKHLNQEMNAALDVMANAFIPVFAYQPGDVRCDPDEGIKRGNAALANSFLIDDVLKQNGILERWIGLVDCVIGRQSGQGTTTELFDGKAHGLKHALSKLAREDMDSGHKKAK
jgi:hypothetical protein